MAQKILSTRKAKADDFDFVWTIYNEAVKPLIQPHSKKPWDEVQERERFRGIWNPESSHLIMVDEVPIGWGSARESERDVTVDHLYLKKEHRGKGIGTKLITEMFSKWRAQGKTIRSTIVKGARGEAVIGRFGLKVEKDEGVFQQLVSK